MADDDFFWSTSNSDSSPQIFDRDRHVRYLEMMYELVPSQYESQEINRLTLAYFVISGLDVLHSLHLVDKERVIAWVLSFQAHPKNEAEQNNGQFIGFYGSRSSQFQSNNDGDLIPNNSHLASTYCALAILKTVGYDLLRIDSVYILKSMRNLQQPDGRVTGGATYCAVASLRLMGFIGDDLISKGTPSCIIDVPLLLDWIFQRQAVDGGFQGRPNKSSDTCYAFWVGGVLRILGAHKFIDEKALHEFLLTCQSKYGGFSKYPGQLPDLYHSYYGFCAFSMLEEAQLNPLNVELGITSAAALTL